MDVYHPQEIFFSESELSNPQWFPKFLHCVVPREYCFSSCHPTEDIDDEVGSNLVLGKEQISNNALNENVESLRGSLKVIEEKLEELENRGGGSR